MAFIMIGDDLYSHVPFVEQLVHGRQHFVLVAKPSSHPTLMAAVAAAEGTAQSQSGQWTEGHGARQENERVILTKAERDRFEEKGEHHHADGDRVPKHATLPRRLAQRPNATRLPPVSFLTDRAQPALGIPGPGEPMHGEMSALRSGKQTRPGPLALPVRAEEPDVERVGREIRVREALAIPVP